MSSPRNPPFTRFSQHGSKPLQGQGGLRRLALAIAVSSLTCSALASDASATQANGMPANSDEWVRYLSDFTRNAEMVADPKKFVAALSAVSEPGFIAAATNAMLDQNLYMRSLGTLADPKAYSNYARLFDPATVMNWMSALTNPQFVNALTYVMTDPGKAMRWALAPMDPKVVSTALNMVNPNAYLRLGTTALDPRMLNLATMPMNPNWYGAWAGAAANPNSYGPTLSGWMAQPTQQAMPMPMAWPTSAYPMPMLR